MPISEICNRNVITAKRDVTVYEAAKLMRLHHVGGVVVVDERVGVRIPVGIVTDRDLVIEVMAPELDYRVITLGDIMSAELVTVSENMGIFEAIQYMRAKGVRRLPVVDINDVLVGILTLDDLLELLSEELNSLAKLVTHEQKKEAVSRR